MNLLSLTDKYEKLPAKAIRSTLDRILIFLYIVNTKRNIFYNYFASHFTGVKPIDNSWSEENVICFKISLEKVSTFYSTVLDKCSDGTLSLVMITFSIFIDVGCKLCTVQNTATGASPVQAANKHPSSTVTSV